MKLKQLREHYSSKDNGITWTPKRSFSSVEEIKEAGFFPDKWHHYTCTHCNTLHISSGPAVEESKDDN